jgi:hypothetical protein
MASFIATVVWELLAHIVLRRECRMCTCCTASSDAFREGQNLTNTLRHRAKIAAKINGQYVACLDAFRRFGGGYLEFYAFRAHPPGCGGARGFLRRGNVRTVVLHVQK